MPSTGKKSGVPLIIRDSLLYRSRYIRLYDNCKRQVPVGFAGRLLLLVVERDELCLVKKIGVPAFRKNSLDLVEMASVLGDLHIIHVDFAFASQDLVSVRGWGHMVEALRLKVLGTHIHRRWVIPSNFWLVCSLSFVLKQCI